MMKMWPSDKIIVDAKIIVKCNFKVRILICYEEEATFLFCAISYSLTTLSNKSWPQSYTSPFNFTSV